MGYGRHGKDTVADYLRDKYNLKIASSSWFVAEKAVFPTLSAVYNYKTIQECFDDRHNHRKEWFDLISAYNTPDLSRTSREIFEENDVYVGIRNKNEFLKSKENKLFDISIWVDARERLQNIEHDSSCTITPEMADIILDNNKTITELYVIINDLMETLSENNHEDN